MNNTFPQCLFKNHFFLSQQMTSVSPNHSRQNLEVVCLRSDFLEWDLGILVKAICFESILRRGKGKEAG